MAPRRRKIENRDYPTGLSPIKRRGNTLYRYRFPNGQEFIFPSGTTKFDAIEAAVIYNRENRNAAINLIQSADRYNKPLCEWLPTVRERYINEERPGVSALDRFDRAYKKFFQQFGEMLSKSFDLSSVNDFLQRHYAKCSNTEYNRAISFVAKVFDYLTDMSAADINPAKQKKRKPKDMKQRQRLGVKDFAAMMIEAKNRDDLHYLYIAMRLVEQTTHGVNEITNIRYRDFEWLESPIQVNGWLVFGFLYIHRQKTKENDASRVKIPVTQALKSIYDESKTNIHCPYLVHRVPDKFTGKIAKGCTHQFQLTNNYLSRAFSDLRDQMGLYDHLESEKRPTFHEMRATAADAYSQQDYDPQIRLGHADPETTLIYLKGHHEWVEAPPGENRIYNTV